VKAYDPIAMENCRAIFPQITYCKNAYEVADGADAVMLVTEWNEFKFLALERIRSLMRQPVFFDGRNLYEPARMARLGFDYHCIGRSPRLWKNVGDAQNGHAQQPDEAAARACA
jgi:UDPglucose 6-dehydrogenase